MQVAVLVEREAGQRYNAVVQEFFFGHVELTGGAKDFNRSDFPCADDEHNVASPTVKLDDFITRLRADDVKSAVSTSSVNV